MTQALTSALSADQTEPTSATVYVLFLQRQSPTQRLSAYFEQSARYERKTVEFELKALPEALNLPSMKSNLDCVNALDHINKISLLGVSDTMFSFAEKNGRLMIRRKFGGKTKTHDVSSLSFKNGITLIFDGDKIIAYVPKGKNPESGMIAQGQSSNKGDTPNSPTADQAKGWTPSEKLRAIHALILSAGQTVTSVGDGVVREWSAMQTAHLRYDLGECFGSAGLFDGLPAIEKAKDELVASLKVGVSPVEIIKALDNFVRDVELAMTHPVPSPSFPPPNHSL